jgi:hypothetical protein
MLPWLIWAAFRNEEEWQHYAAASASFYIPTFWKSMYPYYAWLTLTDLCVGSCMQADIEYCQWREIR